MWSWDISPLPSVWLPFSLSRNTGIQPGWGSQDTFFPVSFCHSLSPLFLLLSQADPTASRLFKTDSLGTGVPLCTEGLWRGPEFPDGRRWGDLSPHRPPPLSLPAPGHVLHPARPRSALPEGTAALPSTAQSGRSGRRPRQGLKMQCRAGPVRRAAVQSVPALQVGAGTTREDLPGPGWTPRGAYLGDSHAGAPGRRARGCAGSGATGRALRAPGGSGEPRPGAARGDCRGRSPLMSAPNVHL